MNLRLRPFLPSLFVFLCQLGFGQTPVRYTISLANPARHLVQVTLHIPPGRDIHELQLPVWNALYQVRDFAQYMNWIRCADGSGRPLPLTELNPSRWKISSAENGARVEYEMFSDDPGAFGAQLNPHHAFFNLAQILLYVDDARNLPVEIEFRNLPAQWKIATPLAQIAATYSALNYDQLVDSPVEIGSFEESDFNATCGTYRVILDSNTDWDADAKPEASKTLREIIPPLQRIVSTATQWMNDCPFQSYMFIYHATDSPGSGGMEHAYSTAITLPAKDLTGDLDHFTGITAHEFFHLWNVKRIRPQSLEPIDYSKENYTTALWFSEGVDTTASEYIRLRAGLLDESHYLDHLSREITELENRPAHHTQSAEQSSLSAWLEKYPRYSLPERSISYYNKGELLGVLLDLTMRSASHDQASLRQLFRGMNDRYAKHRNTPFAKPEFFADSEAVRHSAEMLSHADLRAFFESYVSGTDEIPWDKFFAWVGLHLTKTAVRYADPGFEAVRNFDLPPSVAQVDSGSNAERSGLKPGDVILQINGSPPGLEFQADMATLAPGATLELVVSRDGVRHTLEWKLASRTQSVFRLQDVPGLTSQQRAERTAWLFGRGQDSAEDSAP